MAKAKRDIYQEVTDRIIEALEAGAAPWVKPWKAGSGSAELPHNAISGNNYKGINTLLLWGAGIGFSSNTWLTFKQAKDLGGCVRKGEKGTQVIFFKMLPTKDKVTGKDGVIPMLKSYTVFNSEQCDDLKPGKVPAPVVTNDTTALTLARDNGATVAHGGDRACFIPSADVINMPPQSAFTDPNQYESTLLHELTHWTGHKSRLDRLKGDKFGSETYAFEELVAEIGSAMLCAHMDVPHEELQHVDYVANWLKVLKGDKKAIFKAAKLAQAASESLLSSVVSVEVAA